MRWLRRIAALGLLVLAGFGGWALVVHPQTPLPRWWNPIEPLVLTDPVTPVTSWKIGRAVRDGATCRATLRPGAAFEALSDIEVSDVCHIRDRVRLSQVGGSALRPVETTCETALRLAMWERHTLQPLARAEFGERVTAIRHQSSYNCRTIRGSSTRMSTHATADAIDVAGFTLEHGRQIELIEDWEDTSFWQGLRNGGCRWFGTVLGPDYNALHADHFHMQNRGGFCR